RHPAPLVRDQRPLPTDWQKEGIAASHGERFSVGWKNALFVSTNLAKRSRSLSVVSEARRGKAPARARCVRALSIQRLEGSRPRLRGTRALCKFNGGKERRRAVPRLCGRARHVTV